VIEIGIRLVAIDVDLTLVGRDLKIGERTRAAVQAATEAGCVVTLTSGRMFRATVPFAEELGIGGPLITYDGALIKSVKTGEIICHRPVPLEQAREVAAYARREGLHLNVYVDDTLYVERYDDETASYTSHTKVEAVVVGDLVAFMKRPPTKLLVVASEEEVERRLPEFKKHFGDRLHVVRSMPRYVEFTAESVSKGSALSILARYLGVRRDEVLAIGDSENDVPMLEFAGIGVAVRNAREEVKQAADYVAHGESGDGVVEAVSRFVLGRDV
jgi:Cof subfamily protein (haloacid dehalogenase superfamily)